MNKPKKVTFIEPRGIKSNVFSGFMSIPLLGIVYLATIAKQAGYDVSILNENILHREISNEELESADILGLSCITATVNRGKEIAKRYKSLRKSQDLESKTIIGGIHASMMPEDVINDFNQVVVGEGENIILDLLSGKRTEKIVYGEKVKNLDNLPVPDFKLIKEWQRINKFPIMTSRGCPHNCNFCSVTQMFGREYRAQSPNKVLDELMTLKDYGKNIIIVDDHFAANISRAEEIVDLMIDSGFNKTWSTQLRTETSKNSRLIGKMKKSGCDTVYVGFESINPQALKGMKKGQTIEDINRTINVFQDNGICVHGMFILGNDSDTKDTFKRTADFCREKKIDYVQYSILTPLPGTPVYHALEKGNRLLHRNWDFYDGLHAIFDPINMKAFEVQEGLINCFKDFYSYKQAVYNALNILKDTALTPIRKMYTNAHLPQIYPLLMKFSGKRIIDNWVKNNQSYLEYLRNPTEIELEAT